MLAASGSYLPEQGGLKSPEIRLAADTILNFLKYVQHHDVCPEYAENVKTAMEICERALLELPQIATAARSMPGDFNLACRILFCTTGTPTNSNNRDFLAIDPTAGELVMYEDKKPAEYGETIKFPNSFDTAILAPANFDAETVFKTTIALHEPQHIARLNDTKKPIRVINAFEECYEVQDITFAPADLVAAYQGITKHDGTLRPVGPVGHVVLLPTIIEDGWDSRPTHESGRADNPGRPISLYMDHAVLMHLRNGMKLRLTVCELDIGVEFVKEVCEVLPSFHVFLPQSLMMQWKPPRPDVRPPPSADDPGAAERRELEQLEREEADAMREQRKVDPELDRELREAEDANVLEKAMERVKI